MKRFRPQPILVALAIAPLSVSAPPTVQAQQVEAAENRPAESRHPQREQAEASGYLGVSVRPLNADLRRHFGAPAASGVLIATIEEDSPAALAGLAVGDVIVGVGGREVGSVAGLHREIRGRSGERVELEVYRDGDRRTLTAELGARERAHHHEHGEDWAEHWEAWGEGWAEWGEEWGEGWAEWGEEFGSHWAEFGAEMGERWGERGAEWGEVGAEIGVRIAEAFAEMDWDEMDRAVEESMRVLDEIDWDEIGEEIERAMKEVDEALDEAFEELDDDDEG